MMTVGSMSRNAYLTFKLGQTNPLFANISNQTSSLFPSSGLFGSVGNNSALLQNALSNRLEEQKDTITKLDEYNKASDKFYSGYFPVMNDLKSSAEKLKGTDFSSGQNSEIIDSVKNFADDYNSAVDFFNNNSKVSSKVANLAASFSSSKYSGRALESIGIDVDSKGKLSIDEERLSAALTEDSGKVQAALGQKGLAGQAFNKVNNSVANAADLVPFPKFSNQAANGMMQGLLLNMFA